MNSNFPSFTFTTQEDWYGELLFQNADAGNAALSLSGRVFEMLITPAQQTATLVDPVKTLTMSTGGGLAFKSGGSDTLVFRVPRSVARAFQQGEYTADVLEVVDGERYLFMPVRIQYGVPATLISYFSRLIGVGVTFASRRQPIVTPVAVAGRQGAPGATIITGTVPPTSIVGKDGDYFIEDRTSSGQGRRMYGPKTDGAWPPASWNIEASRLQELSGAVRGRQIQVAGSLTANLLPNGDWLNGRDGWSYSDTDPRFSIVADGTGPNSNPFLRMDRGVTDSTVGLTTISPDYIPAEEGQVYEAYAWVRGNGASAAGFYIGFDFHAADLSRISVVYPVGNVAISSSWLRRSGQAVAPAGTKSTRVRLLHHTTSTISRIDVAAVGARRALGASALEPASVRKAALSSSALSALGDLIPVANGLPYFTAAGTAVLTTLTSLGRSILGSDSSSNIRKLADLDINEPLRKRSNSFFGGMHRTVIPSDGRRWRLGCGFYMPNGEFWLVNRVAYGHYQDKNAYITLRISRDHGVSWSMERTILPSDGVYDKSADTMCKMPDGSLLAVTMRRRQDADGNFSIYDKPLGIQISLTGAVTTFEFEFAGASHTAFNYGPIMPYPPGGPDARQVWFYDASGGFARSLYINGAWQPITRHIPRVAGQTNVEAVVQFVNEFPGDLRAYCICGNITAPNYTPHAAFSADGTNFGVLKPLTFSLGRAPPYLIDHKQSGKHILVARSANSQPALNLNIDYLGSMSEMSIDPVEFYRTQGASGFSAWSPIDAHEEWVQGMGNFGEGPDGIGFAILTVGERQYTSKDGTSNNSTQGSPNSQVMYSSLPRASLSLSATHETMTSGQGRWLTPNPFFQIATKGKAKRATGTRRIGPDGVGIMRFNGVGGAYATILPGGLNQSNVLRIGRDPGDESTNPITIILVFKGEDVKSFQDKPIITAFEATAGRDFSDSLGLRLNLYTHPDEVQITSTDGNPGGFAVNPTIFVPLTAGLPVPFRRPFGMPEAFGTGVVRLIYQPVGKAGDEDWFELSVFGAAAGTRAPALVPQPFEEVRRRCQSIIWTNYPPGFVPGSDVSAAALAGSYLRMFAPTAAAGAATMSLALPQEMDRDPDMSAWTPAGVGGSLAQGARFLNEATGNPAQVVMRASRRILSVENGAAPAANTRFSGMVLLDASPWPTV